MNDERRTPDPWRVASWEGSREAQLDAVLDATPTQRLAWLEEALVIAHRAATIRGVADLWHDRDRGGC